LAGDRIPRRKIDIRPIIGAAVVFLILGAVIFSAMYLLIIKPAAEELEAAKISALEAVRELSDLGTDQAISDAQVFTAQINEAESKSEVQAILIEIQTALAREQKRVELLDRARQAYSGTFYSGESEEGKILLIELEALKETLISDINAKTTLSQLRAYEAELDGKATTAWRNALRAVLDSIEENEVFLERMNSLPYSERMTKENALAYIENRGWEELRKVRFVAPTVEVPVMDSLRRSPTIREGATVKVYLYDYKSGELALLTPSATVSRVIYRDSDLDVWGVSLWENIKDRVARGLTPGFTDFGEHAVSGAIEANILPYDVSVIYVIEVSDLIGERIIKYEFYKTSEKDVVLVPVV
jgi:hypothetical protein